jgi:uncharacterized protein
MANKQKLSKSIHVLQKTWAGLVLFQAVREDTPGQAFGALLQALGTADPVGCLTAYGAWFHALARRQQSWSEYVASHIRYADNAFTQQCQHQALVEISPWLTSAATHDLACLDTLQTWGTEQLRDVVTALTQQVVPALPTGEPWTIELQHLAAFYRQEGVGLLARYRALQWRHGKLQGIAYPDAIQLQDLTGYTQQRTELLHNTEAFLRGAPALHVLLYGSRGTGKSSLVKALLPNYGDQGLRLIEVTKADLQDLPQICEAVRGSVLKFIIFVDDLSFEEQETSYKALKVVLEGSLAARPPNVLIYATSNRRHLVREFFEDRTGHQPNPDEVHGWDTVQEKLSLSDRFGLTLTFESTNQTLYLQMIHHLAQRVGLTLAPEELERRALQWVLYHNSRSGRTARQCIDHLLSER